MFSNMKKCHFLVIFFDFSFKLESSNYISIDYCDPLWSGNKLRTS